ncbi:SnoaL-like domain-containing protein [Mucilaginibacter sp. OK268]|uniref:nuclear transport factor 2 family protein n=1 Tax=Mucilaginibacter sp. OK268 TaxID=1881048 RepID=UPI00087F66AA|nr:nuclear transport factor 2 family protein [Mucilaginibacter sp. OK268]SDP55913.1 SnoaL-like domain-containing protein [Mucilaginibacter sp. OK268]
MNTQEVANALVQFCREGKNFDAMNELYADNIVSQEPKGAYEEFTNGKEAVIEKSKQWFESVEEIHGGTVSDPIVSANFFAVTMDTDVTFKGMGRVNMQEICVYEVKDGKIVFERFFYSIPEQ